METLLRDVRYGFRSMKARPSFAAVAILALALGIGACSAIFSVVNAVLLKPLPYSQPDRLMMIWGYSSQGVASGWDVLPTSAPNLADWERQNRSFEQIAAFRTWAYNLTGGDRPERYWSARVSVNFFDLLGVSPERGRAFGGADDQPGASQKVILSDQLWRQRFAADDSVVGQTVQMSGETFTIIGVMPPWFNFPNAAGMPSGFRFAAHTDMWTPLAFTHEDMQNRGTQNLAVLGRLKANVSQAQAQADMTAITGRLATQYPNENAGYEVKLVPLHRQLTGEVRKPLLILLGAVVFVLLIACSNVANLMLVRAAAREKEIAIRAALGGARARIARQLLTESVILALTGGLLGTLLAFWAVDLLSALSPSAVSKVTRIKVDARVLLFTLGVSILTGLVFGLAPAVRASVLNLHDSLKDGGRSPAADTAGARIRRVLVVVEVALSLVLLIVSGLLIRSFKQLTAVNPGLEPDHVLTANLLLPFGPGSTYNSPERQTAFFRSAVSGLEASPGIESAGATTSLPLSGAVESTPFNIEGRFAADPAQMPVADYASVTDHFFNALGIPLIEGRQFTERDTMQSPGVVIVNQTMARRNWPGEKAVGKRITTASAQGPGVQWMTVVGVVGDVRQMKLGEPPDSAMYFPYDQNPSPFMTLAVRARSDASSIAETVRQKVWSVDKDQPVSDTRTMSQILTDSVAAPRFNMLLLTIFAVVALVLASVGIYGVISYSVTQRTHEIGVRMALGATRRDVVAMISGQAAGLSLAGAGLGLLASFALTRLLSGLLFGVTTLDAATFLVVPLFLIAVGLVSGLVPALRATRVEPISALHCE